MLLHQSVPKPNLKQEHRQTITQKGIMLYAVLQEELVPIVHQIWQYFMKTVV